MVAKVLSAAPIGYEASIIEVESDAKKALPGIQIVGMGNKSIDEAKERVRSAITNSFLEFPAKKITVNLAPAELPKDGAHFDLAIALSILVVSGQLKQTEVESALFAGELALDGSLRAIKGAINIAEAARRNGLTRVYLPLSNAPQAALISNIEVIGVSSLKDIYLHLKGEIPITPYIPQLTEVKPLLTSPFLDEVHGQEQAKRALVIATAGRHNILLNGPPGAGKTMLAKVLVNLLPALTNNEMIAITKIHSMAGEIDDTVVTSRPFRAPHHTSSPIAIIGGGTKPKPGEISLAHLGVLFLDEMPEYPRATLEALRQPLEDKKVAISRANGRILFPADFMLVATMNPCPCGYFGDATKECTCTNQQISNYQRKLSGPLLDRIDLTLTVTRVSNDTLLDSNSLQNIQHTTAVEQINNAVVMQRERYKSSIIYNGNLSGADVKKLIHLSSESKDLLTKAANKLNLSARSYFKIMKVARTIADIENSAEISPSHISEALQYRAELGNR
jgi:magnesium chelatase family protein